LKIKISLILLICFLLSLNFISSYSLGKARLAQRYGFNARMDLVLHDLENHIESNLYQIPKTSFVNNLLHIADLDRVEIFDTLSNQEMMVFVKESIPDEIPVVKSADIKDASGNVLYHVFVSSYNRDGNQLRKLAIFDSIFRILGLIAGLAVAFLFLRSVLNPYKRIRSEISKINIPGVAINEIDDIEYTVKMFQGVIGELKQKENLLQSMYANSEKRADSLARHNEYILGSISSGVLICDNQGIITRFNKAAEQITGLNQKSCQGLFFGEVFGEHHKITGIFREALNTGQTYSRLEFKITDQQGSERWLGMTSSLISDNKNETIGAAVLLTDLTRIKKLQEISDIQEQMAALGEMSAGLAHELRNSVAAILGFGKLLNKLIPDEGKSSDITKLIIKESLATEEMLSRFLNFAKPLNLMLVSFNPAAVISECLDSASEISPEKEIKFEIDDKTNGLEITGDMVLLRNAFNNLIINACQAIEVKGKLFVILMFIPSEKIIKIEFTDNGRGIETENIEKIFNPFFTTRENGTGLGLALVRKIINSHMGIITVKSSDSDGTSFSISLPSETQIDDTSPTRQFRTAGAN